MRYLMRDIVSELGLSRLMVPMQPVRCRAAEELLGVVSADRKQSYDMREVLLRMIDAGEFRIQADGVRRSSAAPRGSTAIERAFPPMGACVRQFAQGRAIRVDVRSTQHPALFLHNISASWSAPNERGGIAKTAPSWSMPCRLPRCRACRSSGRLYGAGNYGMCGRGFALNFLCLAHGGTGHHAADTHK